MKTHTIPIAKEGYPFIGLTAFATLIAAVISFKCTAIIGLLLTGFVVYFFRDPDRIIPHDDPDAIISPADGRIIGVNKVFDDKYLNEQVYKVSIFMNVFNVHVNRVPFDGIVSKIIYTPGKFYSADSERATLENETCAILIDSDGDRKFAFVQMAGLIARRIVCWAEKNDTVSRGQRCGLIRFGSRVDLYLPESVQLEIAVGQKVKAGESVLGRFSN